MKALPKQAFEEYDQIDFSSTGTYDRWDWELPSALMHEFTTIPTEGWYPSSEVIDNLTDGNIAKYVSNNSGWKNSEYLLLLDNISDGDTDNISNMQIDFSYRFDSNKWQEMSFIIKDANVIDYNRSTGVIPIILMALIDGFTNVDTTVNQVENMTISLKKIGITPMEDI